MTVALGPLPDAWESNPEKYRAGWEDRIWAIKAAQEKEEAARARAEINEIRTRHVVAQ